MGWRKKTTIGTLIGAGILAYYSVKKEKERLAINKSIDSIPYEFDREKYRSKWWDMWLNELRSNILRRSGKR